MYRLIILLLVAFASAEARKKAFRQGARVGKPTCDSKTELGICRFRPDNTDDKSKKGKQIPKKGKDLEGNLLLGGEDGSHQKEFDTEDDIKFYSPLVTTEVSGMQKDKEHKENGGKDYWINVQSDLRKEWADADATRHKAWSYKLAETSCNDPSTFWSCCGANDVCVQENTDVQGFEAAYKRMAAKRDEDAVAGYKTALAAKGVTKICCEITTTLTGKQPTTEPKTLPRCAEVTDESIEESYKENNMDDRGLTQVVGKVSRKALCAGECPCAEGAKKHLEPCGALKAKSMSCFDMKGEKCLSDKYYVKDGGMYFACGGNNGKPNGKGYNQNCYSMECEPVKA